MAKKKEVSIITSLNFGIFPGYCLFATGHSFDEIRQHITEDEDCEKGWLTAIEDDEFSDDCAFTALHRSVMRPDGKLRHYYFVLFKDAFTFTDQEFIILAHEILHICQFYTPGVFDRNKEIEAEAYLHSHLMTQALKALRG